MSDKNTQLVERLSRYIQDTILDGEEIALDRNTPLLKLGIVDSIELVNLLAFIEDELGVEVDTEALKPENFENIDAMARFLEDLDPSTAENEGRPSFTSNALERASEVELISSWARVAEDTELHVLERTAPRPNQSSWLCIPGLGMGAHSWRPLIQALPPNQTVIAVDLAGFGVSKTTREAPSFEDHVEMVLTYLHLHAEGSMSLLGSSSGGLIALEVARRRPDKVASLVLLGVGCPQDPAAWYDDERLRVQTTAPWAHESVNDHNQTIPQNPTYHSFMDETALMVMAEGFGKIQTPIRFIHGQNDPVFSVEDVERASRQAPMSSMEWIEHCGHFPHLEHPKQVAALLSL